MSFCPKSLRATVALSTMFALSSLLYAQQASVLSKHVPELVTSGQARAVGAMEPARTLKLTLSLPLRNEGDLDELLTQINDPKDPGYHHYLPVEEFTARFQPTEADYATLVHWAEAKGLSVTMTTVNRRLIEVTGSAEVVSRAFHVGLRNYQEASTGRVFFAPDREPTIDMAIPLLSISGLDNAAPKRPHYRKGNEHVVGDSGVAERERDCAHRGLGAGKHVFAERYARGLLRIGIADGCGANRRHL